jgi:hypothetical protein
MFVTATYLKASSVRNAATVFHVSGGIATSAASTPGFLGGRMRADRSLGFWTVTAWRDAKALKAFRDGPVHGPVMPRLPDLTSASRMLTWSEPDGRVPRWAAVRARLLKEDPATPSFAHPALARPVRPRRSARTEAAT